MKSTTEDYLKTICLIQNKKGYVRSVALATAFGVSKPTVSNKLKRLISDGYITMDEDRFIHLTDAGKAVAEETLERNSTVRDLLISLGVDESIAEADACEMEHTISSQSLTALKNLQAIIRRQSQDAEGSD